MHRWMGCCTSPARQTDRKNTKSGVGKMENKKRQEIKKGGMVRSFFSSSSFFLSFFQFGGHRYFELFLSVNSLLIRLELCWFLSWLLPDFLLFVKVDFNQVTNTTLARSRWSIEVFYLWRRPKVQSFVNKWDEVKQQFPLCFLITLAHFLSYLIFTLANLDQGKHHLPQVFWLWPFWLSFSVQLVPNWKRGRER